MTIFACVEHTTVYICKGSNPLCVYSFVNCCCTKQCKMSMVIKVQIKQVQIIVNCIIYCKWAVTTSVDSLPDSYCPSLWTKAWKHQTVLPLCRIMFMFTRENKLLYLLLLLLLLSSSHYSTQGFILISFHFIFSFLKNKKNKILCNFTCDLLLSLWISDLKCRQACGK